ncbi:hypothetical protein BDW62DRAFT_68589 [Aspergillus aurantiobrunneus]
MFAMSRFLFTALVALYASMAMCAPTATDHVPTADKRNNVYHDSMASWEVAPYPDADPIILNGTIQQVYAELQQINPNYDEDWEGVEEPEAEDDSPVLEKRSHDLECWDARRWGVSPEVMGDGIRYLRKLHGRPYLSAGPNECFVVSCSWDSPIRWCNDDTAPRYLPSYTNIAEGVEVIMRYCYSTRYRLAAGELDHADKWRVNIQWEPSQHC